MRDGKKIVSLSESVDENGHVVTHEIDVVLNWFEELRVKVPVER